MKSFSLVPSSEGPRREFEITWGLRAGYGPSGRIYDLKEAIRAAHRWMRERDARSEPFLSGMFTRGEVVYYHDTAMAECMPRPWLDSYAVVEGVDRGH